MRAHAFLLTTLLALAATAAQAQTPMRGGARRMELLFKDITLTPAQQAKVDSIQARYRSERPSFTPGTPPDSRTSPSWLPARANEKFPAPGNC